jgi:glycerol-3-phosphate acyltransferase PlsY
MFPISLVWIFKRHEPLVIAFGVGAAILVILTHRKNIHRLLNGSESKARILKRHYQQ